jgi:HNH endonuclease/NUMOD4 motif
MIERWKPIPGYPNYEASDNGRIRNTMRSRLMRGGNIKGYRRVQFGRDTSHMLWHRLVAAAFLGPCPTGLEVNHKNGRKNDNRIENLEYKTHLENMAHAFNTGLRSTKIKKSDVVVMRSMRRDGALHINIARKFGIAKSYVSMLLAGKAGHQLMEEQ